MNHPNRFHGLMLASLLIGSTSALAAPPVAVEPAPAANYQQHMQQQLQQRIDQRLEADMNSRFGNPQDEAHMLAETRPQTPTAVQVPQSLGVTPAHPRITRPTQWEQRFRHNGASFI